MTVKKAPDAGQGIGSGDGLSNDQEASTVTAIVPDLPPQCESIVHGTGQNWHSGPAAYIVVATCPSCGAADMALLCAGFIAMFSAFYDDVILQCGCGGRVAAYDAWTITPLGGVS